MKNFKKLFCTAMIMIAGNVAYGKEKANYGIIVVDTQKGFERIIEVDGKQTGLPVSDAEKIIEPSNELIDSLAEKGKLVAMYSGDFHDWHHIGHFLISKNHGEYDWDNPPFPMGSKHQVPDFNKASEQWLYHCIKDSEGTDFIDGLNVLESQKGQIAVGFVHKGTSPTVESYSAFKDEDGELNPIAKYWKESTGKTYKAKNLDGSDVKQGKSALEYLLDNFDASTKESTIYVTGLALDYCVKSTALSLRRLLDEKGLKNVKIIVPLDTTRAVMPETGKAAIEELENARIEVSKMTDTMSEL